MPRLPGLDPQPNRTLMQPAVIGAMPAPVDPTQGIRTRREAVQRAGEIKQFAAEIETDLRAFEGSADLSEPETVRQFGERVRQKAEHYLRNHRGSEDSKGRLAERLAGLRATYGARMAALSTGAQKALVDRTVGDTVSSLATEATRNPGGIHDLFRRLDTTLDELQPTALSVEAAEAARKAGRERILHAAIGEMIDQGGHEEVGAVLAMPQVAAYLRPETQGALRRRLLHFAAARGEAVGQVPQIPSPGPPRPGRPVTSPANAADGKTIFEMAREGDVTGPLPAIARTLARVPLALGFTPVTGAAALVGHMNPSPNMTQAKVRAEAASRELVRVLQNSPNYSEGEREAIAEEFDIGPQFWDTSAAYINRLIGIDDALAVREADMHRTATTAVVSLEERQHAFDALTAIRNFRQTLGVPPLMRTPDEARKLPSGTVFRNPRGEILQVP